jgi:sRNA-binding carbon storage regulator CsrA
MIGGDVAIKAPREAAVHREEVLERCRIQAETNYQE